MTTPGGTVQKTRQILSRAAFWHPFSVSLGWGLLGLGVVVLFGKLIAPSVVLAAALASPLLPLAAALVALRRRRLPSDVEAAILLDRSGRLEGYPLLWQACPQNAWEARSAELLPRASAAVPRLAPWAFIRCVLPGALFLVVTFLLPPQRLLSDPMIPARDSAARREVRRLAEKLDKMEERKTLPEEELQRLRKELQNLEETALTRTLGQEGWEGIDHLSEQLHKAQMERSARLDQAAAALGHAREALTAKGVDEALKSERLGALQRALSGLPGTPLSQELRELMQKAQQGGPGLDSLDPEKFQQSMRDLQDFLDRELKEVTLEGHQHGEGG